ncbi:MAG: hypothetical protein H6760_04310 [Candidatus Nomurabacteria bacterium]|nr:MAG: hypothetical protein H6760_04310 [Candidatus Nomurabacteria bacterium]
MMKRSLLFFSLFGIGIFFAQAVQAAQVSLQAPQENISLGDTVLVSVVVDSDHLPMNAIEADVHYPGDLFVLEDISIGQSFLQLWPEPPLHQPATHTVHFVGGIPGGTYAFHATVLQMTLRAIKVGEARFTVPKELAAVYMHNGEGSRLPLTTQALDINVIQSPAYQVTVYSPTHPDQDTWYTERDVVLTWEPRANALYSYSFSQNAEKQPDELPDDASGFVEYDNQEDGIYYFTLLERTSGDDWRQVARYRVQIDATPPEPFEIISTKEADEFSGKAVISFQSIDRTSGIDRYDVIEGGQRSINVRSPYLLVDQERSDVVRVEAYDLAGNIQTAELAALPQAWYQVLPWYFWVLLLLVAILLLWHYRLRRKQKHAKEISSH